MFGKEVNIMEERKKAYEWVVTMSGGDFHVLSENQFSAFKDNVSGDKMYFDDFGFNPSFVSSWFKRDAEVLINKYPCPNCFGNGMKFNKERNKSEICTTCEGTGLSI